jgi:hypothetical protein
MPFADPERARLYHRRYMQERRRAQAGLTASCDAHLRELLRLDFVSPGELRSFRAACDQEGRLPVEVIRDFIRVYPRIVRDRKRRVP